MKDIRSLIDERSYQLIAEIIDSEDWSFGMLIEIAGLEKSRDFRFSDFRDLDLRNQDLRGFDFTGSDLRGCLKNSLTIIDATTILTGCQIDWIEAEKKPIVQVMQDVESAINSSDRRKALELLVAQYQSPSHISTYLRNAIRSTKDIQAFFDLADFFSTSTIEDRLLLIRKLRSFLVQSTKRTKYNYPTQISPLRIATIQSHLEETDNSTLSEVFVQTKERLLDRYEREKNMVRKSVAPEATEILAVLDDLLNGLQ